MSLEQMKLLRRRMSRDTRMIANLKKSVSDLQKENDRFRSALKAIADAPIGFGACNGHATAAAALRFDG